MEHKNFPAFLVKVDADQGIVEHLIAVFGNIDLGSDILHNGSCAKTILERAGKIRVLDQHNTDSVMRILGKPLAMREISRGELPLDVLEKYPDATGALWVSTQYLLSTPEGLGAFERIKNKAVDEYSIGYDALDVDYSKAVKDGKEITVRNIRTLRLWEYSPVIFAMNPATATLSAKADDKATERKPWDVFPMDGQYCVYKVDEDGHHMGESLGCHDSEDEARQQVEALYANEKDLPGEDGKAMDEPEKNEKAGRRLRTDKVELVRQLQGIVEELRKWADYDDDSAPGEDQAASGDEEHREDKPKDNKAGPLPESAPTYEDLLALIEIETQQLDLMR